MSRRIAHVFFDADLRMSHVGLRAVIKKTKKLKLDEKEFVVFINRSRSMFKILLGDGKVMVHFNNDGKLVNPEVIPLIPTHFAGGEFKYKKALRELVTKKMVRKGYRVKEAE